MSKATKQAAAFILKRSIRVMQSDLKFGNYSDEIKEVIADKIEDVTLRLNAIENA